MYILFVIKISLDPCFWSLKSKRFSASAERFWMKIHLIKSLLFLRPSDSLLSSQQESLFFSLFVIICSHRTNPKTTPIVIVHSSVNCKMEQERNFEFRTVSNGITISTLFFVAIYSSFNLKSETFLIY